MQDEAPRVNPSQVIAWVKYDVFENAEAEEQRADTGERTWPPYTNLALVNHFWEMIVVSHKRTGGNIGAHVSVDLLATNSRHHRRGAGNLLMEHVVRKADELGLPMTLEGSPEGLKLYAFVCFVPTDEFWVDLERFADSSHKGEE